MNTTKWVRFAYFHIQIIGSVMIARPAWFGGDERSGLFCTGSHWADPFANGCTDVFCEELVVFVVVAKLILTRKIAGVILTCICLNLMWHLKKLAV
jgi:hypothetical protein